MLKKITRFIFVLPLFFTNSLYAQVTLAFQGGEPGNTWGYTSTGASALAIAEASLNPNINTGTKSIVVGGNTGGGNCWAGGSGNGPNTPRTFTFNSVDISSSNASARTLKFNWGNRFPSCNGTGWDGGENLVFRAYHDGVAQAPVTLATGVNNAQFSIKTNQYTWPIPTCVNSFYFTVSVTTNRSDELLFLDDVTLTTPVMGSVNFANAGPDQNICSGTAQLQATGGGTYVWDPSPTLSCTNCSNPIASPAVTTQYIVTVTTAGCTDKDTVIVNVGGPADFNVTADDYTLCEGDTAKINLSGSEMGINYALFQIGSAAGIDTLAGTGSSLQYLVSGLMPGTYQYYITALSPGCDNIMNDTISITVTSLPLQYVTSTVNNNLCEGDTVIINLSNSQMGVTYTLYQNSVSTGMSQTATGIGSLQFTIPNLTASAIPYTYYIVANAGTCSSVMDDTVSVMIKANPVQYTLSDTLTICEGDTVNLQLSGSEMNAVYTLYQNNIITTNTRNGDNDSLGFTIIGLTPGTYTYYAEATLNGCKRIMNDTITVTVAPNPLQYITSVVDDTICAGDTVKINLSNSQAGVTYTLYQNSISTGLSQSPAAAGSLQFVIPNLASSATPYSYYISADAGSCSKIMLDTVNVIIAPNPVQYITSAVDPTICEGDTAKINLSNSEAGVTYTLYQNSVSTGLSQTPVAVGSLQFVIPNLVSSATPYSYYIIASTATCIKIMNDTVDIIVAPTPSPYTTSVVDPIICEGDTVKINLSNSQTGVTYTLYQNSVSTGLSQTPAAGGSLQFTIPNLTASATPYEFYILANIGSCSSIMDDTVSVTLNPNPITYITSAINNNLCEGDTVKINLSNSQTGVTYTLYQNSISTGLSQTPAAVGSLQFTVPNLVASATPYSFYIVANTSTCTKVMDDTVTVTLNPTPIAYITSVVDDTLCTGEIITINLSNSQPGVTYTLIRNSISTGISRTPSTAGPIQFTLPSVTSPPSTPDSYQIIANLGTCSKDMEDTVYVMVFDKLDPVINGNEFQTVSNGKQDSTITATASNGGTLTWTFIPGGTGSTVDGSSSGTGSTIVIDFGTNGGTDTIIITEDGPCPGKDTLFVSVLSNILPPLPECIVVNEIMINPADANDGASPSPSDWVELYNSCCTPIDIGCYVLSDGDFSITIPQGTIIPAYGFYTIGSNNCAGGTPSLNYNTCVGCVGANTQLGVYTNTAEQVVLFRADGNVEDAIQWSSGQGVPTTVNKAGSAGCTAGTVSLPANGSYESIGSGGGQDCSKARSVDGGTTWVERCTGGSFGTTNGGTPGPAVTVNITNSTDTIDVCLGVQDSILTSNGTGAGTLSWTIAAGGTGSILSGPVNTSSVEVDFGTTPGIVMVYLTKTNGSCVAIDSAIFRLTSSQTASIITGNISVCAGSIDTVVHGDALQGATYSWSVNSGAVISIVGSSTRDSVVINYGNPTTAQIDTLIFNANGSCVLGNDTIFITVTPAPQVFAAVLEGNAIFCEGTDSVIIKLNGSESGVNYTLVQGTTPIETITGTGAAFNFSAIHDLGAGSYSFNVVAVNGNCSTTLNTITVGVNFMPDSTIEISGIILCGDESDGSIVVWNSEEFIGYQAFIGDQPVGESMTGNGNNLTIIIPVDSLILGTNKIKVKATTGYCDVELVDSATVVLQLQANAAFTTDLGEDQLLYLSNAIIRFNNNSTPSSAIYLWDFGDGTTSAEENPVHTYTEPGFYDITLTVCNGDSTCCDQQQLTRVEVTNEDTIDIPNVFTPNGDGINDLFHIFRNGLVKYKIYIFSRWGEKIWENTSEGEDWDGINRLGANSPEGTYIYQVEAIRSNGSIFTKTGTFMLMR